MRKSHFKKKTGLDLCHWSLNNFHCIDPGHQMFEAINRVASLEKMQVITAIPGSKVGGLRFFFRRFRTKLRFFKKTRKVSPSFLFRRSFRVDMIWHLFLSLKWKRTGRSYSFSMILSFCVPVFLLVFFGCLRFLQNAHEITTAKTVSLVRGANYQIQGRLEYLMVYRWFPFNMMWATAQKLVSIQ